MYLQQTRSISKYQSSKQFITSTLNLVLLVGRLTDLRSVNIVSKSSSEDKKELCRRRSPYRQSPNRRFVNLLVPTTMPLDKAARFRNTCSVGRTTENLEEFINTAVTESPLPSYPVYQKCI